MVKPKEYHEEIVNILSSTTNIDKVSFDSLRLSKIRDEYWISKEVVEEYCSIIDFFLSISDSVPEYIKFFQIKGINRAATTFEFLETCPIEMEILDIEEVIPDVDVSNYKLSAMLRNSLEKISVSFNFEQYVAKLNQSYEKKKKNAYFSIDEEEEKKKLDQNIWMLCDSQLNLYASLLGMMWSSLENKVMAEIKLYSSNCWLYFKKWKFWIYINSKKFNSLIGFNYDLDKYKSSYQLSHGDNYLLEYYCTSIELNIDSYLRDNYAHIDSVRKQIEIFIPSRLSILKPRFHRIIPVEKEYSRSCIIFPINDIIGVDINSK